MAELSPQAQAVLDAADFTLDQAGTTRQGIAAALRAVADQVVPSDPDMPERWEVKDEIRADLLAIAAELEAT